MECFFEEHPLELADVKLCSCGVCGRIRYRDKWDARLDDVRRDVERGMKPPFEISLNKVEVKPSVDEGGLILHATLEGSYHSSKFKKELSKKIKLQKTTCPTCSRKNSGYFEAVLQFRCEMPDLPVDESQIAKIEKVRGGLDYYLLSNNYARGIASQLSKKGYEIKTSNQTFSRRDGREVYRIFYSIKKEK